MSHRTVRVIDATLREGMQSAAGTFTPAQSVEVAHALVACGVDAVECGHPGIGPSERDRVRAVVAACGTTPVLTHARAHRDDVAAAAATGAPWVGIFIGVNALSRESRLPGRTRTDLHQQIESTVRYARSLGLRVRFTVEDGSRTEVGDLLDAFEVATSAGAERLCVADTVGVLEPGAVAQLVDAVVAGKPGREVEVHLHDDRGLAQANALAAIDAGATWVSTSVNGLGERAGIVDTAAMLTNLGYRGDRPMPDGRAVRDVSRRVGAFARSMPDDRRPVVGTNAFRHVSRLHVRSVERDPSSYEWIEPDLVATTRTLGSSGLSPYPKDWIVAPEVISAEELRHHRAGPGERFVLVDDRFVPGAGTYCIARRIPDLDDYGPGHVDVHAHACDSLFVFLGTQPGYRGLSVEVSLDDELFPVESPASVFIPAGARHSYRVLDGEGTYLNHVFAGDYNSSLLEPLTVVPCAGS